MNVIGNSKAVMASWKARKLEQELMVFFQMQYDLASGNVVGMEALLRSRHHGQKNYAPENLISGAERDGSIHTLGLWVLEKSLSFFNSIDYQLDKGCRVAVNISPIQLIEPDFVDAVAQRLEYIGVAGDCLELEITENAPILNMKYAVSQIERLSQLGVRVVLDDFGTGYTSLPYLASLPVDGLKIDKSFTGQLDCKKNRSIVYSVLTLASTLGLSVVAEGIETESQKAFYSGCDTSVVGQGYHLHLPEAADEVRKGLAFYQSGAQAFNL